jgi:hypothetical protein
MRHRKREESMKMIGKRSQQTEYERKRRRRQKYNARDRIEEEG